MRFTRRATWVVLLATITVLATSGIATAQEDHFVDDNNSIFENDINAIADAGITKGCNPPANTMYCPDLVVDRGAMAAFLRRALDLPASSTDHFTDDDNSIFEGDINAIAEAGITRGCNPPDNTRYCPNQTVSREAMAAFLRRALGLPNAGQDPFTDDNNSIFENDINAIAAAGITKGCNPPANTLYCPRQPVTRGAMAAFLKRAVLSGSLLPNLDAVPTALDFGKVGGSSALTVDLVHPGPSNAFDIVVNRTEVSGPYASEFSDLFDDANNATIQPGGTFPVAVVFTPSSVGSKSATLEVYHSGGNSPLTVSVTGEGIPTELTADPSTLAFDQVQIGSSKELEVTVTNSAPSGSPSIFVDSAMVEGSDMSEFTVLGFPPTGARLQPGDLSTFSVEFDPARDPVQKTANLVINHDGDSSPTVVSLTGEALNTAPVASDDAFNTVEDTALNIASPGVLENDSDINGDSLTAKLVSGPADGTLTPNSNGSFTYTPDLNFNGTDSFTYLANDGLVDSNTATVNITVDPVNDAPVANNDPATVEEDSGPNAINVLANDTDPDGDPLTITTVTQGANGTVAITGGGTGLTYDPDDDFSGTDSFTYTISDGNGGNDTATVNITVTSVNDPPSAADTSASGNEDTTISWTPSVSDPDGDPLTCSIGSQPANGTASVDSDCSSGSYTPDDDFHGSDSFTYEADDGPASDTATVNITVASVNDAPTVSITQPEDSDTVSGQVEILITASDDADSLNVEVSIDDDAPQPATWNENESRYEFMWDTTDILVTGDHTIEAFATDANSAQNSHLITVTVDNLSLVSIPGGAPLLWITYLLVVVPRPLSRLEL